VMTRYEPDFYRSQHTARNKAAFASLERKPPRSGVIRAGNEAPSDEFFSPCIYLFFGGRLTPTCNTDDDEKLVMSLLGCAALWR
jgi:hypothetical protein